MPDVNNLSRLRLIAQQDRANDAIQDGLGLISICCARTSHWASSPKKTAAESDRYDATSVAKNEMRLVARVPLNCLLGHSRFAHVVSATNQIKAKTDCDYQAGRTRLGDRNRRLNG
jgi:hypothetical protein